MAARKSSRIHPKLETRYRVTNWSDYEAGLRRRGDLTIWFSQEAIDAWTPAPSGQPGGQRRYSDLAILTTLSLGLIFHLPLRQTEGFVDSLLRLLDLDLSAPDHTTLSRRNKDIKVPPLSPGSTEPLHLIVDSTGLEISGAGEWGINNHGQKRWCWRKLYSGLTRVSHHPSRKGRALCYKCFDNRHLTAQRSAALENTL